jgi:hypothetical protein
MKDQGGLQSSGPRAHCGSSGQNFLGEKKGKKNTHTKIISGLVIVVLQVSLCSTENTSDAKKDIHRLASRFLLRL